MIKNDVLKIHKLFDKDLLIKMDLGLCNQPKLAGIYFVWQIFPGYPLCTSIFLKKNLFQQKFDFQGLTLNVIGLIFPT